MAKNKKAFLRDFYTDETGSYRYEGSYMVCDAAPDVFTRIYTKAALLYFAVAALMIAAGWVPSTGMEGRFYLLIPYMAGLITDIIALIVVVRVRNVGPKLRKYIWEKTAGRLPLLLGIALVCAAFSLAALMILLFTGRLRPAGYGAVIYIASQVIALPLLVIIRRDFVKMVWKMG